jgi:hypothetical protein
VKAAPVSRHARTERANPNNFVRSRDVNTSWAFFGQASYEIVPNLTITALPNAPKYTANISRVTTYRWAMAARFSILGPATSIAASERSTSRRYQRCKPAAATWGRANLRNDLIDARPRASVAAAAKINTTNLRPFQSLNKDRWILQLRFINITRLRLRNLPNKRIDDCSSTKSPIRKLLSNNSML